jgi:hypothetical protein
VNEFSTDTDLLLWVGAAAAGIVLAFLFAVWTKGRPFGQGDVFRASRLSSGNSLFPTQVAISPTSVVHYTRPTTCA